MFVKKYCFEISASPKKSQKIDKRPRRLIENLSYVQMAGFFTIKYIQIGVSLNKTIENFPYKWVYFKKFL